MRIAQIDYMLETMLYSFANVSDLYVSVDRPLQVESAGQLTPVPIEPGVPRLTPFQTEIFTLNLINTNRRLAGSSSWSRAPATAPIIWRARRASASTSSPSAAVIRSSSGNWKRSFPRSPI